MSRGILYESADEDTRNQICYYFRFIFSVFCLNFFIILTWYGA